MLKIHLTQVDLYSKYFERNEIDHNKRKYLNGLNESDYGLEDLISDDRFSVIFITVAADHEMHVEIQGPRKSSLERKKKLECSHVPLSHLTTKRH